MIAIGAPVCAQAPALVGSLARTHARPTGLQHWPALVERMGGRE